MAQKSRLRVGAVSFLNTKPLIYPILTEQLGTDIALNVDVPSRIAAALKAGTLDVGLIPIIEYFRADPAETPYRILPDIAIASHENVRSIQLFSQVPLSEVRCIALDTNSRTSVALLKVLLAEKYSLSPTFTSCSPTLDPGAALAEGQAPAFDAVLLIGDPALRHLGATEYNLDLGEAWHTFTGLPFVYACWVARGDVDIGDLPTLLYRAKTLGITQIPDIAEQEAPRLGLPELLCLDYLRNRIRYDLNAAAIAGMQRFYEYAVKNRLAPPGRRIVFTDR